MRLIPKGAEPVPTPFRAVLLSVSIAWTPLSSATAQQLTERQIAFESLADSQWIRLGGIGLGGGALLGSLIGLAIPKWHRQYP
jgi:pantothenate kinase